MRQKYVFHSYLRSTFIRYERPTKNLSKHWVEAYNYKIGSSSSLTLCAQQLRKKSINKSTNNTTNELLSKFPGNEVQYFNLSLFTLLKNWIYAHRWIDQITHMTYIHHTNICLGFKSLYISYICIYKFIICYFSFLLFIFYIYKCMLLIWSC